MLNDALDGYQFEEQEYLHQWIERNPWFNADAELRGAAIALESALMAKGKLGLKDRMDKISTDIRRVFPGKFYRPDDNAGPLAVLDANERRGLEEIQRRDPKMTAFRYLQGAGQRDVRELIRETQ